MIKTLIVEDTPIALIGALTVLNNFNDLQVDSAESGQKALELAEKKAYELVFLDLGLPDIEGFEVAKTLRNTTTATSSKVIIIALTAHAEEDYQRQCEAVGFNGFLVKPLTDDNVKYILHRFIQSAA